MSAAIVLVLARADNGIIGSNGKLPWHLPADLKHFKEITAGKPMIMGRKTFESLPGLLPGRRHIVLTRDPGWSREGAEIARDVGEAKRLAGDGPAAVIGGADIFALFLPQADTVELTEVHVEAEGDVAVPALDPAQWREVSRCDLPAEEGRPGYSFVRLERTRPSQ